MTDGAGLKGSVRVHADRPVGEISPLIYGHFAEHFPRCVYGGYYDPGAACADHRGLRQDVLDAVRRVRPGVIRWPGGNYASAYNWENGVGYRRERPVVFDPVWRVRDTNEFGTAEFVDLCREVKAEPYICLNMGTGSIDEAMHWVEYCNGGGDTRYASMRAGHGHNEPFGVKIWGLGNEMYGGWQINSMDAKTYGNVAREYAKAVKRVDPEIKLTAVGMSMPQWLQEVFSALRQPLPCAGHKVAAVDYVSLHSYYSGEPLGFAETMAAAEHVGERTRQAWSVIEDVYGSESALPLIAWDEWNFAGWAEYDHIEENDRNEVYDLKNALFTASVLNGFIRHCNMVGMANYSPFVNVRGAVHVDGDTILLRPQYHVFDVYANHAVGTALETTVKSGSFTGDLKLALGQSKMPDSVTCAYLDTAATINETKGSLFLAVSNRHEREEMECDIDLGDFRVAERATTYRLNSENPTDSNTAAQPDKVRLEKDTCPVRNGKISCRLPAHSLTAFVLSITEQV
jgi:alpha-N-arabinofuranosidase